jgi:hypothetical protein
VQNRKERTIRKRTARKGQLEWYSQSGTARVDSQNGTGRIEQEEKGCQD